MPEHTNDDGSMTDKATNKKDLTGAGVPVYDDEEGEEN